MPTIGFHASHEQFAPSQLLDCVRAAEAAGFASAMCSDHFSPWTERQGQSGFAWAWLGAAMATTALPFGVVTSPVGMRYHPAVIAQAGATLAEMFSGRFWMAVGSGEALNERIARRRWPDKAERNERLKAAVEIIRALWAGETVSCDGPIPTEKAKLYTLPASPPRLFAAALSAETAEAAGGWADGLITINQPRHKLAGMIDAFHRGGGEGKPLLLQVHLSYAQDENRARANAFEQWRTNMLPSSVCADLQSPEQFEAATGFVRPEDLDRSVRISADPGRHRAWIEEDFAQGFDELYLHNVCRNQREFIEAFGSQVLPDFSAAA